jgi:drug/metabolite transporter (DMT)-like permease
MQGLSRDSKLSNGIWYALFSVVLSSASYPILKTVLNEVSPYHVATWEALFSILFYFLVASLTRKNLRVKNISTLGAIGCLNALGCLFLYLSMEGLHPIMSGLLSRNQAVFAVLLSLIFFKEKFRLIQVTAIFLMLTGSFVFSYRDFDFSSTPAIIQALLSCLFFASSTAIVKATSREIETIVVIFWSKTVTLVLMLLYDVKWGRTPFWDISSRNGLYIAVASIFSAGFGLFLFYEALRTCKMSTVNLIRVLGPIFVALYSIPFFSLTLSLWNVLGGVTAFVATFVLVSTDRV